MAEGKWTCAVCSAENGTEKRFCLNCGAVRDDVPGMSSCGVPADHGPLRVMRWTASMSGMMMFSRESWELTVTWNGDGTVSMFDVHEKEAESRTETEYRFGEAEAARIRETAGSDRILKWSAYEPDWEHAMRPTDISSSSHLTLEFDPAPGTARGSSYSIDMEGVRLAAGYGDRISTLLMEVRELEKPECLVREEQKQLTLPNGMTKQEYFAAVMSGVAVNPYEPPKEPVAIDGATQELPLGSWKCPSCGAVNTGKFCCECGSRKPE